MASRGDASAREKRDSAARGITLGLSALLGALICLIVAFAAAPVASALGGLALVLAAASGTVAILAQRRAGRAAAQAEKLSTEMDLLARRLLALESQAGTPVPRADDGVAEVTAEIGILGGIVRELAMTVAAQDRDLAGLRIPALPPAAPPPVPVSLPVSSPATPPPPAIVPRHEILAAVAAELASLSAMGHALQPEAPAPRPSAPAVAVTPAAPPAEPAARSAPAPLPRPPAAAASPASSPAPPRPDARLGRPDEALARHEAAVLAAFAAGALELHLQPVVALPQRRVTFYEALPRLIVGEERVAPAAFLSTLERAGRGPELDQLMLARAVTVARRLVERGSGARVAYALTSPAASEPGFLRALTRLIDTHPEIRGRLIVSLSQRAWRGLSPQSLEAITDLATRTGLMIDRVRDLRLDALGLAERGVGYAKVPAGLLVAALDPGAPRADIAIEDFSATLARAGIRLIAEEVEREAEVPDLLDLDVPLAQGHALAPARIVRAEVLAPGPLPTAPAAPAAPDEVAAPELVADAAPEAPAEEPARLPFRSFLRRAS